MSDDGERIVVPKAHTTKAAGTPEDIAKVKESYTGQYLKELLGRRAKALRSSEGTEDVNRQRKDKPRKQAAE